jgi:hypothetical protein
VGASPVRVLDATDEQFEAFIRAIGIAVKAGEEGEKWSFDNRCRAINFALKRGRHLPFVNPNNSEPEQKTIPDVPSESAPQQGMIDIPDAPTISGWANIIKATLQSGSSDEHPLTSTTPASQGRPYPDLEGEE